MSQPHSIRRLTPEEAAQREAEAIESDLANLRDKQAGGHHVRNEARALQLQQRYAQLTGEAS
jgi:hypothetical protein